MGAEQTQIHETPRAQSCCRKARLTTFLPKHLSSSGFKSLFQSDELLFRPLENGVGCADPVIIQAADAMNASASAITRRAIRALTRLK